VKRWVGVILLVSLVGCTGNIYKQYHDCNVLIEEVADTSITLHKKGLITTEQFNTSFEAVKQANIALELMRASLDMNQEDRFYEKMRVFNEHLEKAMEVYYGPTGSTATTERPGGSGREDNDSD